MFFPEVMVPVLTFPKTVLAACPAPAGTGEETTGSAPGAVLWCLLSLLSSGTAFADPPALSYRVFPVPSFLERPLRTVPGAKEIRVGDFDGDGAKDLLYLAAPFRKLWIAFGRGNGDFRRPEPFPFEEGVSPPEGAYPVWVQDLDGNGREEILYPVRSGGMERNPPGSWKLVAAGISPQGKIRAVRVFPLPDRFWRNGAGPFFFRDVDGDHVPDIVLGEGFLDRFLVWKGPAYRAGESPGRGEFVDRMFPRREIPVPIGSSSVTLTTVDLDGDGVPDIARAGPGRFHFPGRPGRLLPRRGPRFGYGTSGARRETWTAAAVFNGDREPDLLALDEGGIVRVLVSGWGPWYAETFLLALSADSTVLPGDFNGDGLDDLLLFTYGNRSFSILFNDGTGRFHSAVVHATRRRPIRELLVADLTGDGLDDLVAILRDGREGEDAVLFLPSARAPGAEHR